MYDNMPAQIYVDRYRKMYYQFLGLEMPIKSNKEDTSLFTLE